MSSPVFAKRGYTGAYVGTLQRRLRKELGDPSLADDGVFGSKTEEAVKLFQSSRYLEEDGIVGEFTDACLFGKNLDKLRKVPKHVHQGDAMRCWAAATESWLTTRPGRRRVPQQDMVDLLVADGGARAADGGLIIPFGQGLWEGYFGLSPIAIAAADFTAESCVRRMAMFGPLMLGSRSHGIAGHVQVMWGARVRGGYPQIEVIDPLTTSGSPVSISVVSIRSYSGGFTVWVPTRLPLLT